MEQKTIKKIGVLTSGGDAPGMNAAIRAVVRTALYHNVSVIGIRKGYNGLINGEIKEMYSKDVSNVMNWVWMRWLLSAATVLTVVWQNWQNAV